MVDQLLFDLLLSEEQFKDLPLPDAQQPVRVYRTKTDERAVGSIGPVGRDHMNVAMVMHKFAKRLNAGNRAGENVVASEHAPIDSNDRLPRRAGEPSQETPIVAEKDAQPLRDRPYDLPMGPGQKDPRTLMRSCSTLQGDFSRFPATACGFHMPKGFTRLPLSGLEVS